MSVAIGPLARSTRLRSRPEQSSGVVPPLFDLAEGLRARTQPEVRGQVLRTTLRLQAASCTSTPSDQCDQVTKYTGRERNEGGRSPRTRLVRSTRQDRATPTKIDPTSFEASFPTQRVLRRRPPCPTSVLAHPSSHCWSASRSAFGFRCSHP